MNKNAVVVIGRLMLFCARAIVIAIKNEQPHQPAHKINDELFTRGDKLLNQL